MGYLIIFCASALNGICNVLGECYNRRVKTADSFCYTIIISLIVFLFYLAYGGFSFGWDLLTFLTACAYGLCYSLTFVFMLKALEYGYVSLVSLIMAYSLMLPTIFGIFFYKEYPSVWFYIGLALLVAAVFLIRKKDPKEKEKTEQTQKKVVGKWIVYAFIAMIMNGALSILQTYQQKSTGGEFRSEFMMTAMIIVFAFSAIKIAITARSNKESVVVNFKKGWWVAAIYGIANALLNLLVMVAVGLLPSGIIFSTICGVSLVITFIFSVTIFKERLNPAQVIGFIIGLCSTVIMNL